MKTSTMEFLFKSRFSKKLSWVAKLLNLRNLKPAYKAFILFITLGLPGIAFAWDQPCQVISHSSYNNFSECRNSSSPTTLWVNVHTKLSRQLSQNGDYLLFTGGKFSFNGISCSLGNTVSMPNGEIIADNTVSKPTSSFNSSTNTWVTRVPLNYDSRDIFICGAAITSSTGFKITGWNKSTTITLPIASMGQPTKPAQLLARLRQAPIMLQSNVNQDVFRQVPK